MHLQSVIGGGAMNRSGIRRSSSGYWMAASVAGMQLSCLSQVFAAEWIAAPAVSVIAEYDDNPAMQVANPESNSALIVTPRARVARYTETTRMDAGAELSFARNNSDRVDDEYSQRVAFRVNHRPMPLNELVLDADLLRDTLRRDVTGGGDVIGDDLPDIDSGRVVTDVDRRRIHLTPTWRRQLTQRVSGRIEYDLIDVAYSNEAGTGLIEYAQHRIAGSTGFGWTPNTNVGVTLGFSAYRPDGNDEADNVLLTGNLQHRFTERVGGDLSVGARTTEFDSGAVESRSSGLVLNAGLRMRTETGAVRMNAEHSALPSGIGRLLDASRINLEWNEGLSERMGMFSRVSAYRTRETDDRLPQSIFRYASFDAGVSWAWTRQLSLTSFYRYRWQNSDNAVVSPNSSAVFAGINYGTVENERFSGSLRY